MFKNFKKTLMSVCCFATVTTMCMSSVCVYAAGDVQQKETVGDSAYKVVKTCEYKDFDAKVTVYEHLQTGAHVVHWDNSDIDRGVGIAYRTYPDDSTGVNHILEHCVCAGSSKYDDTNLFFDISGKTSHTYLNAMTGQEFTIYLASSLFESQVLKFAEMFMNCSLFPMFLLDDRIFYREACRYELENTDSDLKVNGTVLNEMKDAYTKGSRYLIFQIINALVKENEYYDAGGNPEIIPTITYEKLKQTWEKYYHPSNCVVFLYGDLEVDKFLDLFDKNFWCNYEKRDYDLPRTNLELKQGNIEKEVYYPSAKDSENTGLGNFYRIYHGKIRGSDYALEDYHALVDAFNHKDSPFKRKMRERLPDVSSRVVCQEVSGSVGIMFSAIDIKLEDRETFSTIVTESIEEVFEKGFSKTVLKMFENDTPAKQCYDVFKKKANKANIGMAYMSAGVNLWVSEDGWDWVDELVVDNTSTQDKVMKALKAVTDPNEGYALITAIPKTGMMEQKDKEFSYRLQEIKKQMSEQSLNALVSFTQGMSSWLKQGGNPQIYKKIADADIDTLKFDVAAPKTQVKNEDGIRVIRREMEALPEVSANILSFGMKHLSKEERHLAGETLGLAFSVGTSEHSVGELQSLLGDHFYKLTTKVGKDTYENEDYSTADISWVGLATDCENMIEYVKKVLTDTNFSNVEAIRATISKSRKRLLSILIKSPEFVAVNRGKRYLKGKTTYPTFGDLMDTYRFICKLENDIKNAPEITIENMKNVLRKLCCSDDVRLYVSSNSECCDKTNKLVCGFVKELQKSCLEFKNKDIARDDIETYKANYSRKEAFISDSAGSSNGAIAICPQGVDFDAKLQVLARIIENEYLLKAVRDNLGAYGCNITFGEYMIIDSNSDPNVEKTFEAFKGICDWFDSFQLTQELLDSYKLRVCTDIVKFLTQDSWSGGAIFPTRVGRTQDYLKQMIDIIKSTTVEDIRGLSGELKKMLNSAYWYSVGDTKKLGEHKSSFDNVIEYSKID